MIQQAPIIVRIIEPPGKLETLSDVIVGAVGLSGLLTLIAVAIGIGIGALRFWLRSRERAITAESSPLTRSAANSDTAGPR